MNEFNQLAIYIGYSVMLYTTLDAIGLIIKAVKLYQDEKEAKRGNC